MTILYAYPTERITSAANPLVKDLRRAVSRGEPTAEGLWIAEGFHVAEEALRSGRKIAVLLVSESARQRASGLAATRIVTLPDALFQSLAATETSQGVIALVDPPKWQLDDLFARRPLVVVLDALQDPGNAGAVVRAAEAFGATGVLFVKGSTNPFHTKTLRASMGSVFRAPLVAGLPPAQVASELRARQVDIWVAMPFTGSEPLAGAADLTRPCALIVGNEGRGVSDELRAVARPIAIPTVGVESLNAAVAAAVLLYEIRRQRQ